MQFFSKTATSILAGLAKEKAVQDENLHFQQCIQWWHQTVKET